MTATPCRVGNYVTICDLWVQAYVALTGNGGEGVLEVSVPCSNKSLASEECSTALDTTDNVSLSILHIVLCHYTHESAMYVCIHVCCTTKSLHSLCGKKTIISANTEVYHAIGSKFTEVHKRFPFIT